MVACVNSLGLALQTVSLSCGNKTHLPYTPVRAVIVTKAANEKNKNKNMSTELGQVTL